MNKIKKCLDLLAVSSKCLRIHYNKEYSCTITSSCREVVRRFQANYPGVRVPSREAVRLKQNIRTEINAISEAELMRVKTNFLRRCRRCIDAEGQHFQHLL